jgi:hypothetical protein
MKVLHVGDVVGRPGRRVFARTVRDLRARGEVDLVVVNGENAASGKGITDKLAEELFAGGADIITLGDHTWDRRGIHEYLERCERIVRPANFAPGCPGRGLVTFDTPHGVVTVINLVGRVFMNPYDCPFRKADELLASLRETQRIVLVDFHAEATAEKIALGYYLDGRVSAVVGTHTHVQTADARVLAGGTAYLTDLGMTGPVNGVIGTERDPVLKRFLTGLPVRFEVPNEPAALCGAWIEIDERTGRARTIETVRVEEPADDAG